LEAITTSLPVCVAPRNFTAQTKVGRASGANLDAEAAEAAEIADGAETRKFEKGRPKSDDEPTNVVNLRDSCDSFPDYDPNA
jgi:hypothetical protein